MRLNLGIFSNIELPPGTGAAQLLLYCWMYSETHQSSVRLSGYVCQVMSTYKSQFSPMVTRFISHEGYALQLALAARRALLDEETSSDLTAELSALLMFQHVLVDDVFAASMAKEWIGTSLVPAIMAFCLRQMCSGTHEDTTWSFMSGMLRLLR